MFGMTRGATPWVLRDLEECKPYPPRRSPGFSPLAAGFYQKWSYNIKSGEKNNICLKIIRCYMMNKLLSYSSVMFSELVEQRSVYQLWTVGMIIPSQAVLAPHGQLLPSTQGDVLRHYGQGCSFHFRIGHLQGWGHGKIQKPWRKWCKWLEMATLW